MARRRYGRKTLRETMEAHNAAHRFYAAMAGKEPKWISEIPPKRSRRSNGSSGKPLERDVLKAVVAALRLDPRVANVERNQSGLFQDGNRFIRVGTRGKLDLTVYLHGGRFAEIEVKRPGGKPEPHQAERIAAIRANGGIAGYATSPEEALSLLP